MSATRWLLPQAPERRLLGRFYLSCVVSEVLNVVLPFQFVFLLLALDRPEWAAIPLLVESLVVFALEVPTGFVADRWGRKVSVVLGESISGTGWLMVPAAVLLHGPAQLVVASLAFGLEGLGRTLVSGAEEAWIVDNLLATGDERLAGQYFARERSLASLGGVVAGVAVWTLLLTVHADVRLLAGLWVTAALGQFLSAAILSTTPELAAPRGRAVPELDEDDVPADRVSLASFRSLLRVRPLVAFVAVTVVVAFSWSVFEDAFDIALVTRGFNPRNLAPLGIARDLIGFVAPLGCVALTRSLGHHRAFAALLLVTAAASCVLFLHVPLAGVVGLFLVFCLMEHLSTPVARTIRQAYIPSPLRATAGSISNQASELARTLGLGVFALMLGRHGAELKDAMPGLVEAFSGAAGPAPVQPVGALGLPVADAAIVVFALAGLLAAALLLLFPWRRHAGDGLSLLVLPGVDRVHH